MPQGGPPLGTWNVGMGQAAGAYVTDPLNTRAFFLETPGAASLRSFLGWQHCPRAVALVTGDAARPMEPHWQRALKARAHLPRTSPEASLAADLPCALLL